MSINTASVVAKTGKEIIAPYFIKSKNVYFVSCSFTRLVNIIPANAPVGVKKAPILLPTIEANIASLFGQICENKILIGILLIKLLVKNEEKPYVQIALV